MNDLILALGILLSVLAVTYALYLKNRKEKKQHALEKKDKILNNLRSSCFNSDDLESRKDDEVVSELAEIRKLLVVANAASNTPASSSSSSAYKTVQGAGAVTAKKLRTYFDIGAQTAVEKLDDSLQKSFISELDQNFLVRGNNPDHLSNFVSQGGVIHVSGSKSKTGRSMDKKGRAQTRRASLKKSL